MGWASGSSLMNELITIIEDHVPTYSVKVDIFKDMIRSFEEYDCDTMNECLDYNESPAFREAYKFIYGNDSDDYVEED